MTAQGTLLPVAVAAVVPSPFSSADATEIAIGEDSHDYLIKRPLPQHPEHPCAEYLGYRFATACGLAVPVGVRLTFRDQPEAFGSRLEGGVGQFSQMDVPERESALQQCGPWLGALCALDIFLGNTDRHFDNALYRRSVVDNRWTFLAMDFSRALWISGFPSLPPARVFAAGNTAATIQVLKHYNSWDRNKAGTIAASLLSIAPATISAWISDLPEAWHTAAVDSLPAWWATQDRIERIHQLAALL